MRFGVALQGDKTPDEYMELAKLIDRYAFDVVSVYNDLYFQPAIGPLLLMAPHLHTAQWDPRRSIRIRCTLSRLLGRSRSWIS